MDQDGDFADEFYVILDKPYKYDPSVDVDKFVASIQNERKSTGSSEQPHLLSVPAFKSQERGRSKYRKKINTIRSCSRERIEKVIAYKRHYILRKYKHLKLSYYGLFKRKKQGRTWYSRYFRTVKKIRHRVRNVLHLQKELSYLQQRHILPTYCESENEVQHLRTDNTSFHFMPVDAFWQEKITEKLNLPLKRLHNWPETGNNILLTNPRQLKKVIGDGNCFFRSLSFAITGSDMLYDNDHIILRNNIVSHMKQLEYAFASSMLGDNDSTSANYIRRTGMDSENVWGTETEILAAAHLLQTDIYVYSKPGDSWKWLKYSANFLDQNNHSHNTAIYLQNTNSDHYDIVQSVCDSSLSADSINKNLLQTKQVTQAKSDISKYLQANDFTDWDEIDEEEMKPGIRDTMLTGRDFLEDTEREKIYSFAPGQEGHPLSIFRDEHCEELAFPEIFLGNARPANKNRLVPVHYSDICKSELRRIDRRAAMCVDNIFFKAKKLQMKRLIGSASLAVRKHKTSGKKLTAGDLKQSGKGKYHLLGEYLCSVETSFHGVYGNKTRIGFLFLLIV
ncbi:uncharacterized protein LOC112042458 [Lingula anatina]|uniref:Uncharacterized protein LOC112042458 n=1 Tax=Lingula anatina TaxID=7574 RepID=A0A2R2MS24_LINAN|nr:uncharacterized protein LOC112042458 [Lingula anatina]|eukprot:XP_023932797.1 uncharacterized protein LOC112042458 [Lingula anatina]